MKEHKPGEVRISPKVVSGTVVAADRGTHDSQFI